MLTVNMRLTNRQQAYREYLQSEHWSALRLSALERDGWKCVECGGVERLQVHHLRYRGRWEDGVLEDVETLCRKHHRLEHGFGPDEFEEKRREVESYLNRLDRPPARLWMELGAIAQPWGSFEWEDFAELRFRFVFNVRAMEVEGPVRDWWMDKAKTNRWRSLACRVRKSINERGALVRETL